MISQIKFIKNSQKSFDGGFHDEAQRLATTMRVLLHDTGGSHSLLNQLDKKNMHFLSTTSPFSPINLNPYIPFLAMHMNRDKGSYELKDILDDSANNKFLGFDDWWNELVIYDYNKLFTRKDIVTNIANQDGGAHIDPKLNKEYADLTKKNSLGWTYATSNSTKKQIFKNNPAYLSVRGISEELLYSLELSNLDTIEEMTRTENFFKVVELIPLKITKHNKYDRPRFITKDISKKKITKKDRIIHEKIFNNVDSIKDYKLKEKYKKQGYSLTKKNNDNHIQYYLIK